MCNSSSRENNLNDYYQNYDRKNFNCKRTFETLEKVHPALLSEIKDNFIQTGTPSLPFNLALSAACFPFVSI